MIDRSLELAQLESMLDSVKGEESVFKLYQESRYEDIRKINDVFLQTGISDVRKATELISGERHLKIKNPVINVRGDKGVGKSTLVSTSAIKGYMDGKISRLRYFRYNPTTSNFERLLTLGEPESTPVITVVDDILYFFPDFQKNVLVKGNISYLDNFIKQLINMSSPTRQRGVEATLVYVSDTHSFDALKKSYDNILFAAKRGDLVKLLPDIQPRRGNNPQVEMILDSEFYGKTYAYLGGDIKVYKAAELFADIINRNTGMITKSPRLLRKIIKETKDFLPQIELKIFQDPNITAKIFNREIRTKQEIDRYYDEELRKAHQKLKEVIIRGVEEENTRLQGITTYLKQGQSNMDNLISMIKNTTVKETLNELDGLSEKIRYSFRAWPAKNPQEWVLEEKEITNKVEEGTSKVRNNLASSAEGVSKYIRSLTKGMYDMVNHVYTLRRTVRRAYKEFQVEGANILLNLKYYLELPDSIFNQTKVYDSFLVSIQNYIKNNLETVKTYDTQNVKDIIDRPEDVIRNFNPHTINLISNLSPIPYYSVD